MVRIFFTFVLLGAMALASVSLWIGVMDDDTERFYDYDPD